MPQDGSSSFRMLLEVAEEPEGLTNRTSTSIRTSLPGHTNQKPNVNHMNASSPANAASLSVLAPVVRGLNAAVAVGAGAVAQSVGIKGVPSPSKVTLQMAPSNIDEVHQGERSALVSTVNALSDDPLVQRSMLRATQKQQAASDVSRKNILEEREKRAVVRQRQPKRKAGLTDSTATPSSRHSLNVTRRETVEQPSTGGSPAGSDPGSSRLAQSFGANTVPNPAGILENLLASLIRATAISHHLRQQFHAPSIHQVRGPEQDLMNIANQALHLQQSFLGGMLLQGAPQQLPHNPLLISSLLLAAFGGQGTSNDLLSLISNLVPSLHLPPQEDTFLPMFNREVEAARNEAILPTMVVNPQGAPSNECPSSRPSQNDDSDLSDSLDPPPSRFVRIPCRARSMPLDHNVKTAYFAVPATARHGQNLVCSHRSCRDCGIKFRYCSVCCIPVAKRNFRLKHSHADVVPSIQQPLSTTIPSTICITTVSHGGLGFGGRRQSSQTEPTTPVVAATPSGNVYMDTSSPYRCSSQLNLALTVDETTTKKRKRTTEQSCPKDDPKRRRQVSTRSDDRMTTEPTTTTTTATTRVLSTTKEFMTQHPPTTSLQTTTTTTAADPTQHLTTSGVPPSSSHPLLLPHPNSIPRLRGAEDNQRLAQWADLLRQRPQVTNDAVDAAATTAAAADHKNTDTTRMSQWLMNVLAVSDVNTPLQSGTKDGLSSASFLEGVDSSEPSKQNRRHVKK